MGAKGSEVEDRARCRHHSSTAEGRVPGEKSGQGRVGGQTSHGKDCCERTRRAGSPAKRLRGCRPAGGIVTANRGEYIRRMVALLAGVLARRNQGRTTVRQLAPQTMHEARKQQLTDFADWVEHHITGDEKGEAQIFLDRLFQAFGLKGVKEAGAVCEQRIKKADAGGTAFADLVWKPVVLIEMKRRGEDLRRHYRQAFDYWTALGSRPPPLRGVLQF